jgi:hypothetical protein
LGQEKERDYDQLQEDPFSAEYYSDRCPGVRGVSLALEVLFSIRNEEADKKVSMKTEMWQP